MTFHMTDWHAWHAEYIDPESPLSRRMRVVQAAIAGRFDEHTRVTRVLSLCSGDARDVLEVLEGRPDSARVSATLVELDPELARVARDRAARARLHNIEVRIADAGSTSTFADRLPVELLLVCGVFGNISDADIERTIGALPAIVALGGAVIWTRSRRSPDMTPAIRALLDRAGFRERAFVAPEGLLWSVGLHERVKATPMPVALPDRLFTFQV
jgi:hypothetical protein